MIIFDICKKALSKIKLNVNYKGALLSSQYEFNEMEKLFFKNKLIKNEDGTLKDWAKDVFIKAFDDWMKALMKFSAIDPKVNPKLKMIPMDKWIESYINVRYKTAK
jgi:hypothetical protein